MEPAQVEPLNLEDDDDDPLARNDEMEEISETTRSEILDLQKKIFILKRSLFSDLVSNDAAHAASDMGGMMTQHALFLQIIAFWIGKLDSSPVTSPELPRGKNRKMFQELSQEILDLAKMNSDARTLVQSLLFQFSTQHPFDLGPQANTENTD